MEFHVGETYFVKSAQIRCQICCEETSKQLITMEPAVAAKTPDAGIYVGEEFQWHHSNLSKEPAAYEFQWHHSWNRVSHTKNGTTGWATILQSTNPSNPANNICRIHVCAHNP